MHSVILTTHDGIDDAIRMPCYLRLEVQCAAKGMELIRMDQRGHKSTLAILTKMHAGLLAAGGDYCYVCEHDVMYPDQYFTAEPCMLSYSASSYFLTRGGYVKRINPPLSSLFGKRECLIAGVESLLAEKYNRGKIRRMEFDIKEASRRKYGVPFIDIRHGSNHTGERHGETVDQLPYWGHYQDMWKRLGGNNA